eukprot:SAG31_NODE_333_length_17527_cov_6.972056_15_plen_71_part_00
MELLSSIQRPNAKGSPESQRKTELSPARKELRRRLAAAHKGESPSTGRKFFRHLVRQKRTRSNEKSSFHI